MRNSLLMLTAAALSALVNVPNTFAQRHEIPALNSCIKEFYDPGMYNWLSFRNTCAQALTLIFVPKDGSGPGGAMDLRPGASDSVGKSSAGGPAPKIGAFALYVCQLGYLPVDENNKVVTRPDATFQCQPKPQ